MIARPLWFLAGAGAGVYAAFRARRAAEAFTVDGLRDRASALSLGVRLFAEEVAQGQVEKETELREQFGLRPLAHAALDQAPPVLTPGPPPAIHSTHRSQQENDH